MQCDWDNEKNKILQQERNISFERIVVAIDEGNLVDILEHPNKEKYGRQYLLLVQIENYIYVVPAVRDDKGWFFKTIFPSRKYTKIYLGDKNNG